MKYILILIGIATFLLGCLIAPASQTAFDLILLALIASITVLSVGLATVAHAIDKHREKMEDIAKENAEGSLRKHGELVASISGSPAKVD